MISDFEDSKVIISKAREAANFEYNLLKYVKSQIGTFWSLSSKCSPWKSTHFPEAIHVSNGNDYFRVRYIDTTWRGFEVQDSVNNYKLKNYNNKHKAISQYYFEQIMKEINSRGWSHDIKTIKIRFNLRNL